MSGGMGYLFSGYAVIWILFFAYLLTLWKSQRRLSAELRELRDLADQLARKS
jgi:CcmD family protein